ncbi:hypothetical protein ACV22V_21445 [Burkholderia sp. AW33-5]|uniref:hypothetical protein n=1 Tax=Burkholderia thailandensis TaxID=57975 RepID=UPI003F8F8A24
MTNTPSLFCVLHTSNCMLMSEWGVYWQALGTFAAVIFGVFGLYKIRAELKRLNEQREKEITDRDAAAKLKRTEFFLNQHRRLFDNPELYAVLCLVDSDNEALANTDMWDRKRKFITFFEEIQILIDSGQLDKQVALYMFGHYARCAMYGSNFQVGIAMTEAYWRLFFRFVRDADDFFEKNPNGPESVSL